MSFLALWPGCASIAVADVAGARTGKTAGQPDSAPVIGEVLASIRPIHSLVSTVMQGVGEPELIVDGGDSPHHISLRPSAARRLQEARLIFWMGPSLETFLTGPLRNVSDGTVTVRLDTGHDPTRATTSVDPHRWLDPVAGREMLGRIAKALAQHDPSNAELYRANAERAQQGLDLMIESIEASLAPVANTSFVVYHDAYGAFQSRFSLGSTYSVVADTHRTSGAQRIRQVREWIVENDAACVFIEPQFPTRIIDPIIDGIDVRIGELDPIGQSLTPGVDLYPVLLENLVTALVECLS